MCAGEAGRGGVTGCSVLVVRYGSQKVHVFCKTMMVQRKFCILFPCPFCLHISVFIFIVWTKLFYTRATVRKKHGVKNVVRT